MSHIAVIDIGKTNAKLVLVDGETLAEVAVVTTPNTVLPGPPWPHFDVERLWEFLLDGLSAFHRDHGVSVISITTHGASGVLLAEDGCLAAPVLDYEFSGPDDLTDGYDAIRPDFQETGAPRLPGGLNVGAQLYWMFQTDPGLLERTHTVMTYPQYWGVRLTGVAASDVSSLGCHTDLWLPQEREFSSLVERLGLTGKMAPARSSFDVLGPILPDIAARTGLDEKTPVHCGIHDSNASLLPHVLEREAPFSVVSTGTWVIVMAIGAAEITLDPGRDTLINVNALGDPVPSSRFMGGREFEMIISGQFADPDASDIARVLSDKVMLLPATMPGSGPYPDRTAEWRGQEPRLGSGARTAAASFYLAMMTATCLQLIGHQGTVVVEGPFARNDAYCRMLAAATGDAVTAASGTTGTSHGAAMLAGARSDPAAKIADKVITDTSVEMRDYARAWREAVALVDPADGLPHME